jgi:flagellar basal body-associated protein FliL
MNKKILVIVIVAVVIISIFSGIFLWYIFIQDEEDRSYKARQTWTRGPE